MKILYDEENLYLGIEAVEPAANKIVVTGKTHDDPSIWSNGNVLEFFLAPPALGIKYAHLAVNVSGASWDTMTYTPLNSDLKYETEAEIKTKILGDRWVAEIRIPFRALGGKPKDGQAWKLNIARSRQVEGAEGQLSSWSNGAFHGKDSYRSVIFPR